MNLERIDEIIAKNINITDKSLYEGVFNAVLEAVNEENEACEKVCEKEQFELTQDVAGKNGLQHFDAGCRSCAEMIRARREG